MTENKRYSMKKRGGALFYFKDGVIMSDEDVLFDLNMLNDTNNALKSDRHRFEEENKQLKSINQDHKDHLADFYADYDRLEKENERLKAQLYCDSNEGVCLICNYHYLEKGKTYEKYYISKCKKGHEECSKMDLKYCDDFELKEGDV